MTFFDPHKSAEFMAWLLTYVSNRIVVDAGCGRDPELTRYLKKNCVSALGCDPWLEYCDDLISCAVPLEFEKIWPRIVKADKPIVVVTARPDHSGWVNNIFDMLRIGDEWLYLGLEKNIDIDISCDYQRVNAPNHPDIEVVLSAKKLLIAK